MTNVPGYDGVHARQRAQAYLVCYWGVSSFSGSTDVNAFDDVARAV